MKPQHKIFADKYIETGNVYQSAIAAGYSDNYAKVGACKLLENVSIKQYIGEQMAELSKPTIASADEVLQYLTRVMRGEEKDQFGLDVSIADRTKAAESLGKRYALFTDKTELSGKNGKDFVIEIRRNNEDDN
jgi:phage terminase small subunit